MLTTKWNMAPDCPVEVCFTYDTDVTASSAVGHAILIPCINVWFSAADILLAKNVMSDKALLFCRY